MSVLTCKPSSRFAHPSRLYHPVRRGSGSALAIMANRSTILAYAVLTVFSVGFFFSAEGQTRKRAGKKAAPVAAKKAPGPDTSPAPPKRNERPVADVSLAKNQDTAPVSVPKRNTPPAYRYEFSQPDFVVSSIKIEHDESGTGTITFRKKGDDESITDPIRLSPKTISRINDALTALNFLDSNESYQHEKDFSHLGNMKFARTAAGKTREVAFNYTANKNAKLLMDEYRKIGNQYIWVFDIKVSRENQPLESPKLMDSLDSLIKRNEISDPVQMEPFLRELSDDESIPLIARNHAARLVKQFEKEKEKEARKKGNGQ